MADWSVDEVEEKAKEEKAFIPNLDMVLAVARKYLRAMAEIGKPPPPSDRKAVAEWETKAEKIRDELRNDMERLGLTEAIDCSD